MMNKIAISMSLCGVLFAATPAMAAPRGQAPKAKGPGVVQRTKSWANGKISKARAGGVGLFTAFVTYGAAEPDQYEAAAKHVINGVADAGTYVAEHPVATVITAATSAALANGRVRNGLAKAASVPLRRLGRGALDTPGAIIAAGVADVKAEEKALEEVEKGLE